MLENNSKPQTKNNTILETAKIDSFTLLIPLEECRILNPTFLQRCNIATVVLDTGEEIITEEDKLITVIQTDANGIKTRFSKINRLWKGESIEFIRLVITSKHLREPYLEGINQYNIKNALEYVISLNIISFDIDKVLNSRYFSDIDICIDYKLDDIQYEFMSKSMKQRVLPIKQKYIESFKNNLQFNDRISATLTTPFIKLYDKHKEFTDRLESAMFYDKYLKPNNISTYQIKRLEVTLKDSKAKKLYNIQNTSLIEFLSLSNEFKGEIVTSVLKHYYKAKMMQVREDLTPSGQSYSNMIAYVIQLNPEITTYEIVNIAISDIKDKKAKSRQKKKTLEIIEGLEPETKKLLQRNNESKKDALRILSDLGIIDTL